MQAHDPTDLGTVYIVDDDALMRSSLRHALEQAGYRTDAARSSLEFLARYDGGNDGCPECLLLDVFLPDMDGLELHRELRHRGIAPMTIFLSGQGTIAMAVRAIRSGGVDFLEKPVSFDQLIDRVRQAMAVDAVRRFQVHRRPDDLTRFESLSPRERDVLQLLLQARTVKQISAQLQISGQTAAKHKQRVLQKLGAENDADLQILVASVANRLQST